jgi:hypothetical protein
MNEDVGLLSREIKTNCTDFLFSSPSFFIGMGTVLNIGGNYYAFNCSSSEEEADRKALASDWEMIGKDFRNAMKSSNEKK